MQFTYRIQGHNQSDRLADKTFYSGTVEAESHKAALAAAFDKEFGPNFEGLQELLADMADDDDRIDDLYNDDNIFNAQVTITPGHT